MGKRKGRDVNGVLLVDKPQGMSSNAVLQKVRWLFNAQKAGHTGSLDPLATGLLPVCFGQATKACEYLLSASKSYLTEIKLGVTTDTYDAEGTVVATQPVSITDADLQLAFDNFRGDIWQEPPMYSALKKDGQPLYKLARKGKDIERAKRAMTVYELTGALVEPDIARVELTVSSGFYVRSFAHDLGLSLGCGAHIVSLRRTAKQDLAVESAHTLESLQQLTSEQRDALLKPVDCLLSALPSVSLSGEQCTALLNGQPVTDHTLPSLPLARLQREQRELFAIGEINTAGKVKTHKIFVKSGIY